MKFLFCAKPNALCCSPQCYLSICGVWIRYRLDRSRLRVESCQKVYHMSHIGSETLPITRVGGCGLIIMACRRSCRSRLAPFCHFAIDCGSFSISLRHISQFSRSLVLLGDLRVHEIWSRLPIKAILGALHLGRPTSFLRTKFYCRASS